VDDDIVKVATENNPKSKFSKQSIYDIKWPDEEFEIVIATEVLEHLRKPHSAIKECKRVSKRYCVFSVPYEPFWRISNIFRLAYLEDFGNTPGHIQHWNKTQFKNMLKKHFRKVKIKQSILWNIAICEK
jgi:ubiquinone/menaquinone biosynthesis C-methylase UbiE